MQLSNPPNPHRAGRLCYPRAQTCAIGYYSLPPPTTFELPPSLTKSNLIDPNQSIQPLAYYNFDFQQEHQLLQTIEQSRTEMETIRLDRIERTRLRDEAAAERERRRLAEEEAERLRKQEEEEQRLKMEAEKKRLAEEEAAALAAEEEQLRIEQERLRKQHEELMARKQKALPIAQPLQPLQSMQPLQATVVPPSQVVGNNMFGYSQQPLQAIAVPSPYDAQHEQTCRQFMDVTGVTDVTKTSTLLQLLKGDVQRAIALYFSDDASIDSALEKARLLAGNAPSQPSISSQPILASQPLPYQPSPAPQPFMQSQSNVQPSPYGQPSMSFGVSIVPITILLPDGTAQVFQFSPSDTLWLVYEHIVQRNPGAWANKMLTLSMTTPPHTLYKEAQFNLSIAEAGWYPHQTIRAQVL